MNPRASLRARKDFVGFENTSAEEIHYLLDLSAKMKTQGRNGPRPLVDRCVALIFSKSSTRTRVSFETAVVQLGGHPIYLAQRDLQLGRGETITDTGRVMERYVDAVVIRTYAHEEVTALAGCMKVPVINGLTDYNHPCQILADLLTMREAFGTLKGLSVCYVGDFNNVANTLALACSILGIGFRAACPEGYGPSEAIRKLLPNLVWGANRKAMVAGSDVVYTDTWVSMGQEEEQTVRLNDLKPYQVNDDLMAMASPRSIFLHCLPAHRGHEVTDAVIDGPRSRVLDEAENRLHVQKAVLDTLLGEPA